MENNLKPFDLEAAKEGAPVVTRDGRPARIIYSEAKSVYNIIALVEDGGDERPISVTPDGKYRVEPSNNDLFMVSVKREGWVNVYRDNDGEYITCKSIYESEYEAEKYSDSGRLVATAKIEWEE